MANWYWRSKKVECRTVCGQRREQAYAGYPAPDLIDLVKIVSSFDTKLLSQAVKHAAM